MSAALIALAAGGTALDIYGKYKESKNRSQSLIRQAEFEDMRANELIERNEINNQLLREKGARAEGALIARSAASTDTLGALESVARDINRQAELNERDAKFEANMMRLQGAEFRQQADDTKKAFKFQAASSLLSGGASIAGAAK